MNAGIDFTALDVTVDSGPAPTGAQKIPIFILNVLSSLSRLAAIVLGLALVGLILLLLAYHDILLAILTASAMVASLYLANRQRRLAERQQIEQFARDNGWRSQRRLRHVPPLVTDMLYIPKTALVTGRVHGVEFDCYVAASRQPRGGKVLTISFWLDTALPTMLVGQFGVVPALFLHNIVRNTFGLRKLELQDVPATSTQVFCIAGQEKKAQLHVTEAVRQLLDNSICSAIIYSGKTVSVCTDQPIEPEAVGQLLLDGLQIVASITGKRT